jgi:formamidopyrimidine-DNA glycosylase
MPELPEVETICRGLARKLPGHKIVKVQQNRRDLRIPFPAALKTITGAKVMRITRRAKYILAHLDDGRTLILHLGMSGSLTARKGDKAPEKHDHLIITLENDTQLTFNDPRRFGLVALARTKDLPQHKFFTHLGPEPLGKDFTAALLGAKLRAKKTAIKLAIMDQRVVVGVGNIYASEALFGARIDPRLPARALKPPAVKKLVAAIRKTLKAAIKAGGSSLRDYVQADGSSGGFQKNFSVYGRAGKKCKGCTCDIKKTGGIKKITQGARSTFYCPVKQGRARGP